MTKSATTLWICALLLACIFSVYGQVWAHDFINYDDPVYVTDNPQVRGGLTWTGVSWAFTSFYGANWFPVTWLSHMLDCQLFGVSSGWHHLINVFIHALATLCLFGFLQRTTGARWRSAFVAFVFALHPLHVESVAWIAERKDVLSALFWFLTLWAYAAYVARPSRVRYVLTLFTFCVGLMAKPMLVTLPLALLALDYWPLNRGFLWLEKIPFFTASIVSSVVTYIAHKQGGAVASAQLVPLATRIENALVSYVAYVSKTFWPTHLAVFYPYPTSSLLVPSVLAGIFMIVASMLAVLWRRQRPYVAVGWFWYVVTLLPVIGFIQTGEQARADRYTYIPMVGLTMALVWGIAESLQSWRRLRVAIASAVAACCIVLTWVQVQYWKDSFSLYQHAIAVVPDNYIARFNLASALAEQGREGEAIEQLRETVRIRPEYVAARAELGQLLVKQGQVDEGVRELQTAVKMRPDDADAHFRLGSVYGSLGRGAAAEQQFAETARLQPDNADAHYNLGLALAEQNKLPQAVDEFNEAVRLKPDDAEAHFNLGIALVQLGQMNQASAQFSEALRLRPNFPQAKEALERAMSLQRPATQ